MYKSKNVTVGLVSVAAATFVAGCGEETAYCVDEDGQVVSSYICDDEVDDLDDTGSHYVVYGGKIKGGKVSGGKKYAASSYEVYSRGGFGSSARTSGSGSRSASGGS